MNILAGEWLLLRRSRTMVLALVLLCALAIASVCVGVAAIERQRSQQRQLVDLQSAETAVLAEVLGKSGDAGYAAYYTFHPTWNSPGSIAFAALGFRDVAPQALRIRALGLEAQIHENDSFNPELALAGRFDFAFVVIYLAPLFLIALLHDLVSRERETGRLPLLAAIPGNLARVWWIRASLRALLAALALLLPLLFGAWTQGASWFAAGAFSGVVFAYLLFWVVVIAAMGLVKWAPSVHAAVMVAVWATLTLALPTSTHAAIAREVPVTSGVELTLAHREFVNAAWDKPKHDTMAPFLETHPEWRDTSPVTARFHWKWYYAFHQVADQQVAASARSYREGLLRRQQLTEQAGWLLPSIGAQALLHRLASTDLPAQLAYEDAIREFHSRLRHFYYPYFFEERRFNPGDFDDVPRFE